MLWLSPRLRGEYRRRRGGSHHAALAPSTTLSAIPLPRRRGRNPKRVRSRREPEVHHVAILHNVVLAFEAHLAGIARARLAAEHDIIVIGNGFGADEALLEIGVDGARGLRRARAFRHRPGARLLRAGGEGRDQG